MALPKSRGPTMQSLLDVVKSVKTVECSCDGETPEIVKLKNRLSTMSDQLYQKGQAAKAKAMQKTSAMKAIESRLAALKSAHAKQSKAAMARKNGLILQIKAEGATERNIEAVKKFAGIK